MVRTKERLKYYAQFWLAQRCRHKDVGARLRSMHAWIIFNENFMKKYIFKTKNKVCTERMFRKLGITQGTIFIRQLTEFLVISEIK